MEVLGDVVTDKDVQLAVAYAQIEANQVNVTDGSTVFERTRGYRASIATTKRSCWLLLAVNSCEGHER